MKIYNKKQAAQKLVKMISVPEFTEDIASGYVEVFLDMAGKTKVEEYDFDIILDSAGEEGWLD